MLKTGLCCAGRDMIVAAGLPAAGADEII